MKVSAQYAREHFDELLHAEPGQEFEIALEGQKTAKLIIMPSPVEVSASPSGKRILGAGAGDIILGAGRGELVVPTDEEWRQMKEEDARLMNDAPLMTSGEV